MENQPGIARAKVLQLYCLKEGTYDILFEILMI